MQGDGSAHGLSVVGRISLPCNGDIIGLRRAATIARLALSSISDAGSGTGLATMLSRPTGLLQHGVAGFESEIRSVSMICAELEFTVAKLPKVFGTVPASVKTFLARFQTDDPAPPGKAEQGRGGMIIDKLSFAGNQSLPNRPLVAAWGLRR